MRRRSGSRLNLFARPFTLGGFGGKAVVDAVTPNEEATDYEPLIDYEYENVLLLLHMDAPNGSTTFVDHSIWNNAITREGTGIQQTTQESVRRFGSSVGQFSGGNNRLLVAASSRWNWSLSDFTLELQMNTGQNGTMTMLEHPGTSAGEGWALYMVNGYVCFGITGEELMRSSRRFYDGKYHHVAVTRETDILRLWVDGRQENAFVFAGELGDADEQVAVGGSILTPSQGWNGWLDEVRITLGTARYQTEFEPPLQPFPDQSAAGSFFAPQPDYTPQPEQGETFGGGAPVPGGGGDNDPFEGGGAGLTDQGLPAEPPNFSTADLEAAGETFGFGIPVPGGGGANDPRRDNTGINTDMDLGINTDQEVPPNTDDDDDQDTFFAPDPNTDVGPKQGTYNATGVNTGRNTDLPRVIPTQGRGTADTSFPFRPFEWNPDFYNSDSSVVFPTGNQVSLRMSCNALVAKDDSPNDWPMTSSGNVRLDLDDRMFGAASLLFTGGLVQTNQRGWHFNHETGDATIEMWMNSVQQTRGILASQWRSSVDDGGWILEVNAGVARFWFENFSTGAAMIVGTTKVCDRDWHHIAVTRRGNLFRLFVDGKLEGSATQSGQFGTEAANILFGGFESSGSNRFSGYIDDVLIVKGLAKYKSDFLPPIAAHANPANAFESDQGSVTSLLNFDAVGTAGLEDAVSGRNWNAFGPITFDSNRKLFGARAARFQNTVTTQSLRSGVAMSALVGNGDWTLEGWFFVDSLKAMTFWAQGNTGDNNNRLAAGMLSSGAFRMTYGTSTDVDGSAQTNWNLDGWNHIAWVLKDTTLKIYLNGKEAFSSTTGWTYGSDFYLGQQVATGQQFPSIDGIDSFRLTKGLARYTKHFTPPHKAFDDSRLDLFTFDQITDEGGPPTGVNFFSLDTAVRLDTDQELGTGVYKVNTAELDTGANAVVLNNELANPAPYGRIMAQSPFFSDDFTFSAKCAAPPNTDCGSFFMGTINNSGAWNTTNTGVDGVQVASVMFSHYSGNRLLRRHAPGAYDTTTYSGSELTWTASRVGSTVTLTVTAAGGQTRTTTITLGGRIAIAFGYLNFASIATVDDSRTLHSITYAPDEYPAD